MMFGLCPQSILFQLGQIGTNTYIIIFMTTEKKYAIINTV